MNDHLLPLASLLKQRLSVIADSEFRKNNPQAHLAALREVSEAIESEHQRIKPHLSPRLRHFLQQASFQKALDHLESGDA